MKNHVINGHYMFGNTFIQPEMPMYNRIPHHNMAPVRRPMPPYPDMVNNPACTNCSSKCYLGYEHEANKVDTPYEESDNTNSCDCSDCPFASNGIIRDPLVFNVTNIETSIVKTLKVTIYGTSTDQDKTVEMTVGNRYAITYITEHGLFTSVGKLELISDSVPDTCTRYINSTNMAAASTAYIGMDCSTEGNSNKTKIYIATIRYIQDLKDGDEVENVITTKSFKERLELILDRIEEDELKNRVNSLLDTLDDVDFTNRVDDLLKIGDEGGINNEQFIMTEIKQ